MNAIAKSIVAALIAGLGALQVAGADQVITGIEWVSVATTAVTALGLVWAVPNTPTDPDLL